MSAPSPAPSARSWEHSVSDRIRVAVVGYGAIGRHHARNLNELNEEVDFVGVVDASKNALAAAAELGYPTFQTLDEAVALGLDAVVLSLPTALHFEYAVGCIDLGLAVLVEKPIAMTSEQGAEIIERARAKGVPLMIGYVERFNPAVVALRDFIRAGGLGEIYGISARRVGTMPARIQDANVLIDIGVHDIDMAAFLLASDLELLAAQGGRAMLNDRVDYAFLALQGRGVPIHIESNWITPVKAREVFVTGANGICHVDCVTQSTRFAAAREFPAVSTFEGVVDQYKTGEFVTLTVEKEEPLRRELRAFFAGIRTGELPPPEISLVSLRIAEQATAMIDARTAQLAGK